MKTLYIMKVGTTFPAIKAQYGDFDQWTARALGEGVTIGVVDVEHGAALPAIESCAGVVITGSHSMVTDNLPWSVQLEQWLRDALKAALPILGVCYGHQLLARAAGGDVANHPQGKEVGTVAIQRLPACDGDPLLGALPSSFLAHTTHLQSVLTLPVGAIRLASNRFEPNHAFRLGERAYGVQFHPEYSVDIMRAYIEAQQEPLESAGRDVAVLLDGVRDTPDAAQVMTRFVDLVRACQQC